MRAADPLASFPGCLPRLPRGAGSIIAQVRDFALDQPEVEYFTFSNVDYYKKGDPRASLSLA